MICRIKDNGTNTNHKINATRAHIGEIVVTEQEYQIKILNFYIPGFDFLNKTNIGPFIVKATQTKDLGQNYPSYILEYPESESAPAVYMQITLAEDSVTSLKANTLYILTYIGIADEKYIFKLSLLADSLDITIPDKLPINAGTNEQLHFTKNTIKSSSSITDLSWAFPETSSPRQVSEVKVKKSSTATSPIHVNELTFSYDETTKTLSISTEEE